MVKQELLEFLEAYPGSAATDVAGQFGLLYTTAAMALLRLSRQGLVARAVDPYGVLQYALTERGHERLDYFRDRADGGSSTMKHAKTHTGTYHCPACMIEFELVAETSLKCDACQGPLAAGSLDEIWDDEDEPG